MDLESRMVPRKSEVSKYGECEGGCRDVKQSLQITEYRS